ncbi:VOC family protein [Jeotgalibacillus soli]|uniref:VOC domain-containing protein n=1 Tax=Jeotgalibacillus soli TaxID=889306 RepID=A0A0C2VL45_9BACL|nr:VOC family protein [Jeotgalibacillus soli]KIL49617.1 hypothetical protein KP78_10850 [Jeotgalibacillus soli]
MIHHIELYVSNLEKSKSFWSWLLNELNYTVYQEWDRGISYKHGDVYIVFVPVEDGFDEPNYHRKRVGLNHLAFHAQSKEQVDNLAKRMKQKGIRLLYEDRFPYAGGSEHYALFAEDPDRIKVEIVALEC